MYILEFESSDVRARKRPGLDWDCYYNCIATTVQHGDHSGILCAGEEYWQVTGTKITVFV